MAPCGWLLLALHASYLVVLYVRPGRQPPELTVATVAWLGSGLASLVLGYWVMNLASQRHRGLHVVANLSYVIVYGALAAYAAATAQSFDYAVLHDNIGLIRYAGTRQIILRALEPVVLVATVMVAAAALMGEPRRRWISRCRVDAGRRSAIVFCAAAYLGFVFVPRPSSDALIGFLQSADQYYALERQSYAAASGQPEYPLIRTHHGAGRHFDAARAPHVFLVMIESFNAKYIGARTEDGRPYTPVFDGLISRGWYVERFYGNSIQTAKGQFAALLSVIPSVRGRETERYESNRFYSLAQALRDHGYRTLFFQGHRNLGFDNAGGFMARIGFDEGRSAVELIQPDDRPYVWGWGPEDHVVYRRFFELVDTRLEKDPAPLFAVIATINNHMLFDVPEGRRLLFPKPRSMHERYANSLHLADHSLAVLFAELERRPALRGSLVVITGDHSFPTGDHGIEHNEVGYYEESFRTPLLMIWPGRLEPRRIAGPYSQLDLAPTLVDLVGVPLPRDHFQGRSMLAAGPPPLVYLVQPYAGAWLGVVDYPFKYLKRLRYGEELLFDLAADPREEHNLIHDFTDQERLDKLRHGIEHILLTHHLVRHDRVWDGHGARVKARPLAPILVIAHRGNSVTAPENTLAAMDEAFDLGAQVVEVDVHLSRDGVPVVIHDGTVDRTTDGGGPVAELTLDQLKALDAGGWKHPRYAGERIPSLVDVLRLAAGRGRLLIDPKAPGLGRPVAEAFRLAGVPPAGTLVGTWNREQESEFASHLPGAIILQTGQPPKRWARDYFSRARRRGVVGFELGDAWPAEFIVDAHGHGMPVFAYTVNDEPTMRQLLELGIDGIETDDPGRLISLLAAR